MTCRLLLWDIDGTLVRTGPIGGEVFDLAMLDVVGRAPPGRVRMSGKTDPLIVREHLALLGVDASDATVGAVLDRLATRLAAAQETLRATGSACPGVPEVLRAVRAEPGVTSGVLTGNLEPNARVKLAAYGLDTLVDLRIGAFGSDDEDRDALVPFALRRAAAVLGTPVDPDNVWVIGDTPRDLACARAGEVRCLLVATGTYGVEQLGSLGADATLDDLTDTEAVVKLLTA